MQGYQLTSNSIFFLQAKAPVRRQFAKCRQAQLGVQQKPFGIVSLAYDFTQMLVI